MLRQPLLAAALALAALAAAPAPGGAGTLQTGSDFETSAVQPGSETNAVHQDSAANTVHQRVVVHRPLCHHVYRNERAPAPYYDAPDYGYYAPAPAIALPVAAACVALSLIGAC